MYWYSHVAVPLYVEFPEAIEYVHNVSAIFCVCQELNESAVAVTLMLNM